MGTYYIPRNVKGESRILYIFSVKSLITTVIAGAVGLLFYLIFGVILGIKVVGIGLLAICALIGFAIGSVKIPTLAGMPFTKKVGGEALDQVIIRYMKFKKNRKVYTYTKEEE